MPTDSEIILRLVIITLISGLIGLEREFNDKPAGIRTNVIVGIASTLITIASIRSAEIFNDYNVDPTRIAAQIVTGIGFIGAGVILRPSANEKTGSSVTGLTTAATLLAVSGLGIAVGIGLYTEAIVSTLLIFFTFMVLSMAVEYIRKIKKQKNNPPR